MSAIASEPGIGWWRTASTAILLGAAAILAIGMLAISPSKQPGFDYRFQYYAGAERVADGRPLYPASDESALEAIEAYVYPPQLAVGLVPLTARPEDVAVVVALLVSLGALFATLAVVGVRDVRCYAAVLLWWPTWTALANLNLTVVLALGVALAWRFRKRVVPMALVLGTVVSAKHLLWPLVVWAAAMRRLPSALLGLAFGLARPRLSAAWLLPLVLWLTPRPGGPETIGAFLPALVVTGLMLVLLRRSWPARVPVEAT